MWLCKLAQRGMLRPSCDCRRPGSQELRDLLPVPAHPDRGADPGEQRAEKLLEDDQIKLSVVISDIFGVSGRDMLEALIAGQRDPYVLARLGPSGSMRKTCASCRRR